MTNSSEQFACVYIKDFPAQAMLRLRPSLRDIACVVMEGVAPLQRVCSISAEALRIGAVIGMNPSEIETFPGIHTLLRSDEEERSAKAVLLECAWTLSPRVEAHSTPDAYYIVVDLTGTETLHGSLQTQASRFVNRIKNLGFQGSIAISNNYHAAICMARSLDTYYRQVVIPLGFEKEKLSSLSLSVLDMPTELTEKFQIWGIHTLGMLADLPEYELISRLGQEGKRLLKLANGKQHHLFCPLEPSEILSEYMELDTPVDLLDSLLFVVSALLEQLVLRAMERILALASTRLSLTLEGSLTYERTITPALPTNDRKIWKKLIHLDLESHPPSAPILAVRLTGETAATSTVQMGLFSPQIPEANRLEITLARIRSIVGEDCVGSAVIKNTHQRDSFFLETFHLHIDSRSAAPKPQSRLCSRQLRPPERILVKLLNSKPAKVCFRQIWYRVHTAYGPWLTNGDWWNSGLWSHEQWDILAQSSDGRQLSSCLIYTSAINVWHLVSLYD